MSRYFAPISKNDLMKKISECDSIDFKNLNPQVLKDLSKVQFDTENISSSSSDAWGWLDSDAWGWLDKNKNLLGYQTFNNGFTFLGINAGGDWETPIFFIIYFSGKELRGYIPTKGNTWNTLNKSALGNDDKKDFEFLGKLFPKECQKLKRTSEFVYEYRDNIKLDAELLEQDIKARILPRSSVKSS